MIGYCPFCGRPIGIEGQFYNNQRQMFVRITWQRCRSPRCDGAFENIVTDEDMFVRSPYKIRGRFIGRIPDDTEKQFSK